MIFTYLMKYFVMLYYEAYKNTTWTIILYIFVSLLDTYAINKIYVSLETFIARIVNHKVAGSFMSTISSVFNFSNKWYKPFILYSVDYVPFSVLVIIGFFYSVGFVLYT